MDPTGGPRMDERGASFGDWVRRRRRALDLTQAGLADRVSCSQAAIKKIEAEERRPSRALAQRLAEHLGIPAPERAAFVHAARLAQALPQEGGIDGPLPAQGPGEPAVPPLVGRDAQLAQVAAALEQARHAAGQVLLVQGEAGIGKSRLLQEALHAAGRRGFRALRTNCYEIERSISYQPVVDLARQACDLMPDAGVRRLPPVLLAQVAELVPALARRVPGLPPLSADFPEARQARLFQALVELFDAAAEGQGLLAVVDNVQWADDASMRFLHRWARQVATRPVLLAWSLRDDEPDGDSELAAAAASLRGDGHVHQLLLPRLALADVEALLQGAGGMAAAQPGAAERLLRESEGNPFFLWSILHAWSEAEALPQPECGTLPEDLRDSVRARLARVPPAGRGLLELAAVLGHRFHFEMLLALGGIPEPAFLQALDLLVRRRLLRQEPGGSFHDFSHDKVREVVYADTGSARRVLLHRQVAQRLAAQAGDDAHELHGHVAEHCERGEAWAEAVHYLSLAAGHSLKLFAIRESLQWFDRALALAEAHPGACSCAQRLALLERRGAARAEAGLVEGAVADLQRVIDAARAAGEPERARDVLILLGMAWRRADRYDDAIACLQEALAASRAVGDERHVADSLYHLGTVAWSNGRNDLAIAYHQEAVDLAERLGLGDLVAVQAFHGRGEAAFAEAHPAAAIECFSRSLELARAIGDRSYESENLMMLGWACLRGMGTGADERALASFDAALEIARVADFQWHLPPTLVGRAMALSVLGRTAAAWTDLREALRGAEALGLVRYQVMARDAMGALDLDAGRPAEAARHFERALVIAGSAGIRYWQLRVQAGLALAQLRQGHAIDSAALAAGRREALAHRELWQLPRVDQVLAEAGWSA